MWTEGFAFRNALPAQTGTLNTCDDLHQLTDVCCSYAVFCKDMIIPRKTVNIYPNNKPWVTRAVKCGLGKKKKRLSFQQGSLSDQHAASRELKTEISKAKNGFKSKMEDKMQQTIWVLYGLA